MSAFEQPARLAAGQHHAKFDFVGRLPPQGILQRAGIALAVVVVRQLPADRLFPDQLFGFIAQLLLDAGAVVFHDRRLAQPRAEQDAVDIGCQVAETALALLELRAQIVLFGHVEHEPVDMRRRAVGASFADAAALEHPAHTAVGRHDAILGLIDLAR